jgi:hypothetical protein
VLGADSGYSDTFNGCINLSNVVLENGLTILGSFMFSGSGLTSVVIPSTVTSFGLIIVVVVDYLLL